MTDEKKPPAFDPDKTMVERRSEPPSRADTSEKPAAGQATRPVAAPPPATDSDRTMISVAPVPPSARKAAPDMDRTMVGGIAPSAPTALSGGPANFELVGLSGTARGRKFGLRGTQNLVGSNATCQVVIPGIESVHAKFQETADGAEMQNLGTEGSIIVGGRRSARATLKSGDLLKIGDVVLRFVRTGDVFSSDYSEVAVNVKGAIVVVAAGNTGQDCAQNPPPEADVPNDPRGWKQAQTIVSPAWYSPLVLTVGGIGQTGQPSTFSMSGPWVDTAAPAENITALGYDGNPVNALNGTDGPIPITGTSFAAAHVSGLATLLKQRFPDLTAAQIMNRITSTARHPGGGVDNYVGAGVIDPVAALTWDVPAGPRAAPYRVKQLPPPVVIEPPDRGPITIVVLTAAGLALALGIGALTRRAMRRR